MSERFPLKYFFYCSIPLIFAPLKCVFTPSKVLKNKIFYQNGNIFIHIIK